MDLHKLNDMPERPYQLIALLIAAIVLGLILLGAVRALL